MTSQEKKFNIVSLDVGGQIFKTKLETLTKVWVMKKTRLPSSKPGNYLGRNSQFSSKSPRFQKLREGINLLIQ